MVRGVSIRLEQLSIVSMHPLDALSERSIASRAAVNTVTPNYPPYFRMVFYHARKNGGEALRTVNTPQTLV